MTLDTPRHLLLVSGKGTYPLLLAQSARKRGVERITALAFRGETRREITRHVDDVIWLRLGQLADLLEAAGRTGAKHAVMAGQLTPTALFTARLDSAALAMLKGLERRNAHTIFAAVADSLSKCGVDLLPANVFMESNVPEPGVLGSRHPSKAETNDISLGLNVAKVTSDLDIGQTVVVRQGTILAVEAFEGTNQTIKRAGALAGPGIVVVKVAKPSHDMRFDIPVIGMHTVRVLRSVRASVLAIEARRTLLLDKDDVIRAADSMGLSLVAMTTLDAKT